jgi:hypothetical protein
VPAPTAYKPAELLPKILACFGPSKINLLVCDEGHRLIEPNPHAEPKRLELLRDLYEMRGVSVLILATPQYSAGLEAAGRENPRWNPAQWIGRAQAFDLPDRLTAEDLAAVARHHAPTAADDAIAELVAHAEARDGSCGLMVKAVQRGHWRTDGAPLTADAVREALRLVERESRTAQIVPLAPPRRRNPPIRASLPGAG